jgi:hypothetical protein
MPKMAMSVPHDLSQEEALRRIKTLLERVKSEHPDRFSDLEESWSEDGGEFSAKIMGMDVSGRFTVTPTEVQLSGNIPFAALPFRGQIEETIQEQAAQLLA